MISQTKTCKACATKDKRIDVLHRIIEVQEEVIAAKGTTRDLLLKRIAADARVIAAYKDITAANDRDLAEMKEKIQGYESWLF